jgi:hypothetical protein
MAAVETYVARAKLTLDVQWVDTCVVFLFPGLVLFDWAPKRKRTHRGKNALSGSGAIGGDT